MLPAPTKGVGVQCPKGGRKVAAAVARVGSIVIPAVDSDAEQQAQISRLKMEFERYLFRRRGPLVGMRWKRDVGKFLTTTGTTYEQIRARLESDFNLELSLTQHELAKIVSP